MENTSQETQIDVLCNGMSYTVTNMHGKSIAYLKNFLVSNGLSLPQGGVTMVFSMGPNENNPEAILRRRVGIVIPTRQVPGILQILQGDSLVVTDDYELSLEDRVVKFEITGLQE